MAYSGQLDALIVCTSFSYPPRKRWVSDVVAYTGESWTPRVVHASFSYPPRKRWVSDVMAYTGKARCPELFMRLFIPTS
jgi:hypothetical protein